MEQLLLELLEEPKSIWLVGEMVYTQEPQQLTARRRCTAAEFTRLCLDPFWQRQALFCDPICGVFPGDCVELAEGVYELGHDYRLLTGSLLWGSMRTTPASLSDPASAGNSVRY